MHYCQFRLVCKKKTRKVKLNISQLALTKLVQTGEHQTGMEEVPSSILTEGNFLLNLLLLSKT